MTLPVLPPLPPLAGGAPGVGSPRRGTALVTLGRVPGQEHPGQGDVLELAQVAELVLDGQAPLTHPAERFTQLALRDPHPRPQRRDRPHVGGEVADVQALRLVEQVERAAPDLLQPAGSEPSRPASDTGSAAARCARPAPGCVSRCCVAASRSLRSRQSSLMPTCMSAAPRQHRARVSRSRAAIPARRCSSPRGDGLARSGCPPG